MKKLFAISILAFLASCGNPSRQVGSIHGIMGQREETVYICTGPMSQCYHKDRHCYGLKNCSKRVKAITLQEAQDEGRRPCRYCYGQHLNAHR